MPNEDFDAMVATLKKAASALREADVIAAGDIYMTTTFPEIDVAAGGNINGIIEGLNTLLDTVPESLFVAVAGIG